MRLNDEQQKLVDSKVKKYSVIRGKEQSGKTTALLHRLMVLRHNYLIYSDDDILLVPKEGQMDDIKSEYKRIDELTNDEYRTFFSKGDESVHILNLKDIIDIYIDEYNNEHGYELKPLSDDKKIREYITQSVESVRQEYPKSKILNEVYLDFFLDEIEWIKSSNLKDSEYQEIVRRGRKKDGIKAPSRVAKNSVVREIVLAIKREYTRLLKESNFITGQEVVLTALGQAKISGRKFTHIMVDGIERLNRVEMQLLTEISTNREYSSVYFIINVDNTLKKGEVVTKKGNLKKDIINESVKKFNFKDDFIDVSKEDEMVDDNHVAIEVTKLDNEVNDMFSDVGDTSNDESNAFDMDKYEYVDLKRQKSYNIVRDFAQIDELTVNDGMGEVEFGKEETVPVPVFNNIAAGTPIEINEEQTEEFFLPQQWLKGSKDSFILKVKGDSMKNIDINDEDLVVIKAQQNYNHRDILAVNMDGNATLKRLNIDKEGIFLMPENELYEPIPIIDEGVFVIGKAIGVIKKRN